MLTSKLTSTARVKVKQEEPKVKLKVSDKVSRPFSYMGQNKKSGCSDSYIPHYRKRVQKNKAQKPQARHYKSVDKENISSNLIPKPTLKVDLEQYIEESKEEDYETPRLKEYEDVSKIDYSHKREKIRIDSNEVQKLIKMNLDMIQTFSQGIEASKSLISALANSEFKDSIVLSDQIKLIQSLDHEVKTKQYVNDTQGILSNLQSS